VFEYISIDVTAHKEKENKVKNRKNRSICTDKVLFVIQNTRFLSV
jgi:hypothetical protein